MAKKRRLSDMYVTSRPVEFDDGEGDTVKVVVRKLNPIEHERALKTANAARALSLMELRDQTTLSYLNLWDEVESASDEELIEVLLEDERMDKVGPIEAELEAEEEWSKDGYLLGLQEAWEESVKDDYARDPKNKEAAKVFGELKRFADRVEAELEGFTDNARRDLEDLSIDSLRQKVLAARMVMEANATWLAEFRRCELWLSVREEDGRTPYFVDRDEVDSLPVEILARLSLEYRLLSVEPAEGKDSREKDAS